jgi:hypothetical protein
MKTKIFKMILPMAVITFGIAGALSTNAMSKKSSTLAERWGYTHLEAEPCTKAIMCSTIPGTACKNSSGDVLYDFVSSVSCPNPLYKI